MKPISRMLDCLPHWNTTSFLSACFPSSLPMLWRLSSTSDEVLIFHSSENCSFLQESAGAGSSYHKRYFNGGSAGYRWVRKAAMQWKRRPPPKGWRKRDFTLHLAPLPPPRDEFTQKQIPAPQKDQDCQQWKFSGGRDRQTLDSPAYPTDIVC